MRRSFVICFAALTAVLPAMVAAAPIDIYIDRSSGRANLGFSEFVPDSRNTPAATVETFQETVEKNLEFTQLFNLIKHGPVVKRRQDSAGWLALGTDVVLGASVERTSRDELKVSAALYDATSARELLSINERRPASDTRALAHEVANQLSCTSQENLEFFTRKLPL
jgi:hypothetical protein